MNSRRPKVVEFFATTDGQAVLANVAGSKIGEQGTPALPGGGEVEVAAYDAGLDLILEDHEGFVQVAEADQIGLLLARPWSDRPDGVGQAGRVRRGRHLDFDQYVFSPRLRRRFLAAR